MNTDHISSLYASAVDEAEYMRVIECRDPERETKFTERMARAAAVRQFLICGSTGLTPEAENELVAFSEYLASGGQRRHGSFTWWKAHGPQAMRNVWLS